MPENSAHLCPTYVAVMLFIRSVTVSLLCLSLFCILVHPRDRAAAREAYRKADDYHSWLMEQDHRDLSQYRQSIYLYRLVIDHDPTYGACDDSLFAIASLYEAMARDLGQDYYRRRAIYYYEFVAREYPLTRHKKTALDRASRLKGQKQTEIRPTVSRRPSETGEQRDTEPLATLSEVRYWSNEDYTRIVLQLDREVMFEKVLLSNPDRMYFDLAATRVDPTLTDRTYEVNGLFIKRIRVAENRPQVIRVVLDFNQINQHTVFALYSPYRIVIDTRGKPQSSPTGRQLASERLGSPVDGSLDNSPGESSVAASGSDSTIPTIQGNSTLTRTLGLKVGRVVLDPGHGGKDTGTVGPTGLQEKDLVLRIAKRLRTLLEEELGTDVVLTRSDDRFVPLEERTAIANQKGADLFISIHANSSRNNKASGIETYVLDFTTSSAEMEVASRENASAQRNIRELEDLLRKIALGDYNQESRNLAQTVQHKLVSHLSANRPGQKNRGIKQAPFIVLIGSNMPSILTEIGFISNPNDEKYFRTESAQNAVAEALYQGVETYFKTLGTLPGVRAASASGR